MQQTLKHTRIQTAGTISASNITRPRIPQNALVLYITLAHLLGLSKSTCDWPRIDARGPSIVDRNLIRFRKHRPVVKRHSLSWAIIPISQSKKAGPNMKSNPYALCLPWSQGHVKNKNLLSSSNPIVTTIISEFVAWRVYCPDPLPSELKIFVKLFSTIFSKVLSELTIRSKNASL